MLEQLFKGLFDTELTAVISVADFLLCLGFSLLLGLLLALAYMYRTRYTKSFVVTLALLPAFALVLVERARETRKNPRDWPVWAATAGVALGLACSVIFSNPAYLRKQVEFDSTVAAVNRIVMTMEQTDGYVVGQTPVAWVGALSRSDAVVYRDGLGELRGYGVSGSYAIGHYRTVKPFFTQVMGYPLELVSQEEAEALAESDAVQAMPVFPNKGYCQVVDGIMVIRLSE